MELYEAIEKRRTIRVFKGPATKEQLRKIILAGTKAPSGRNTQPWEFIIVDDQSLIKQIAEIKYDMTLKMASSNVEERKKAEKNAVSQKEFFKNASIVAACHRVGGENSVWLSIENISLAAVAEGLGTGIAFYFDEERAMVGKLLGLPEDCHLTAVLKIGVRGEDGYPREKNPYATRRREFSWLHKNRYGESME